MKKIFDMLRKNMPSAGQTTHCVAGAGFSMAVASTLSAVLSTPDLDARQTMPVAGSSDSQSTVAVCRPKPVGHGFRRL